MVILGISGFEDDRKTSAVTAGPRFGPLDDPFHFGGRHLPLQYFPLNLIGHDCSAALLVDGRLVAFAAEERFTRIKHGLNLAGRTVLPRLAVDFCLKQAGLNWENIDIVAHFCKFTPPTVKRRIESLSDKLRCEDLQILTDRYFDVYDHCFKNEVILKQLRQISGRMLDDSHFFPVRHHLAHAAGAFYSSGLSEALILTVDGYGEEESSLVACGLDSKIEIIDQIKLPTSLGLLYQILTVFLGFRSFGDEYKVMGLSSYGDRKIYRMVFNDLIELKSDGTYSIAALTTPHLGLVLKDSFGDISWHNGFSQKAANIAAALQEALENTLLHSLHYYQSKSKMRNLCLSGGVALNATANGVISRSGLFKKVFIQPAAADDGTSLGAALYVNSQLTQGAMNKPVRHTYWGPRYKTAEIESILRADPNISWQRDNNLIRKTAELLAEGNLIGWFQGRMEMGPRALGARSILSDPRRLANRERLNSIIKHRELFRPFASSVLKEQAPHFFDLNGSGRDPYMITTVPVRTDKRPLIPAVVHVDGTSRLQVVTETANPRYYHLLKEFFRITGIPLLLNTSFNQAGEPIVCSPRDAMNCFERCGLDFLVIGNFLVCPLNAPEAHRGSN